MTAVKNWSQKLLCSNKLSRFHISHTKSVVMGWTHNTVNPDADTNGPTIAAIGITFTTVSLLAVVLRMYVRLFMIKAAGAGKFPGEYAATFIANIKIRWLDNCFHLGEQKVPQLRDYEH